MSGRSAQIETLVIEGTERLLTRASDSRSLEIESLAPRIRSVLNKYLLRNDENAPAQAISEFIDGLQGDDLCLIVACEHGDQLAWTDLVERYSPTVRSAARSASTNEDAAQDLAQSIWAELHGLRSREDGKPAGKLAYYSGRGSLAGWLRAVVAQLAVDQHRKQSRLVQTEEDADFDRLARAAPDRQEVFAVGGGLENPEDALSDKLAGAVVETALARSIKDLSAEDRLLVKLYYFDNLRLREAGTVLGVHEATASRRLARIHSELRRRVEEILINEHGWTKAETERSFTQVVLHLESDLELLVAGEDGKRQR